LVSRVTWAEAAQTAATTPTAPRTSSRNILDLQSQKA
jgi:hypothetical protein